MSLFIVEGKVIRDRSLFIGKEGDLEILFIGGREGDLGISHYLLERKVI